MNKPSSALSGAIEAEAASLREQLHQAIPHHLPLTAMLYQPVPLDTASPSGRLVDIGPRPPGAPDAQIIQLSHTGETGSFLNRDRYARFYIPEPKRITPDVVGSFVDSTPPELRRLQVALEVQRYKDLRWAHDDRPPEDAFIYHLSICPRVLDLHSDRLPSFGLVYTMTNTPAASEMVNRLRNAAQLVGDRCLRERIRRLLGTRLTSLQKLLARPVFSQPPDPILQLAVAFLLAHHWFYPYDPAAWHAIRLLAGDEGSAEEVYRRYGWWPPEQRPLHPTGLADYVRIVVGDLLQLGGYMFELNSSRDVERYLENLTLSALCILTGALGSARHTGHGLSIVDYADQKRGELVFPLPLIQDLPRSQVTIPAYDKKTILESARKEKKSPSPSREELLGEIRPGEPERSATNRSSKCFGIIRDLIAVDGRISGSGGQEDKDDGRKWITQFTRLRVMELVEEIKRKDGE